MNIIKAFVGAPAPRGGFRQTFTATLRGCAAAASLLATAHAVAATVVTDTVFSQSTQAQHDVPVTFGQVFKDGDVPRGATLAATLDGQPITLQVDPKATNPDGSLRHAVLTAMVPSLAAGAKLPLMLYTGAPSSGPAIGLPQLLATGYDADISLSIRGKTYTASARSLLQAANLAGACAPWDTQCNAWLSGPLASEWVVNGPVVASDGTSPGLRVYFAVRAYSNGTPGTVGRVHTDIIVENSAAYASPDQPQYTATLTSGSATYTSPALTQYSYTRWHKVLWWNNDQPQVYLQQDTRYIQASLAVSQYMPLAPSESFLASLRQSCAPLSHCDQTLTMGNTGAQDSIGPLPRWTSVYIVDPDVRAYNWMLANTDALGAYSIHYRDAPTGWPISIQRHPYVTIIDWPYAHSVAQYNTTKGNAYKADLLPACCAIANPNIWDNAHQPAEGYVAYMVTGSYYYMEEVAFGASHNEIWSNEYYRGFSKGLIDASHSQPRGKAWVLREMVNAAYLLPDSHPLKAEFNDDVNNALADFNATYTDNPDANHLGVVNGGVVYPMNGHNNVGMPPWQHNFVVWSAGHAAELGFAGAAKFRGWLARFEIGLMTDWQSAPVQGFCWLDASAYTLQVKDAAGKWLPDYTTVYKASFPSLVGLACNSPDMIKAMSKLYGQPWKAGEMPGYPSSATGYPANFQIGMAAAADSGLPNAQAAWNLFDSRSVKPSGSTAYDNYPNFAILPRSVEAGAQPPPTMPPPSDPPPASNPPPVSNPPPANPPPANVPPQVGPGNPPQANPAPLTIIIKSNGDLVPSTPPSARIKPQSSNASPLPATVNTPTVGTKSTTASVASKAPPAARQANAQTVAVQPAEFVPVRRIYLGIERRFDGALQTMNYFIRQVLPQATSSAQAGAARAVAAPASKTSANVPAPAGLPQARANVPTPTSLPKVPANVAAPVVASPDRAVNPDQHVPSPAGAGYIRRL